MNELIESILNNFTVDGVKIPVSFLFYMGHGEPYITYQQENVDNVLEGDDGLIGYADYYDFDVYCKGNYNNIIRKLREFLESNGFVWQISRSSGDMYDPETGYYHKTLNFAYLRQDTEIIQSL